MSCRATNGNSAATSLAKFLTRAKENVVSHVFHEVRAEGMADHGRSANGQKQGLLPASPDDVAAFLDQARFLSRHDPRVPEGSRESLLDRIDGAMEDLRNGQGPNLATFHAWTHLVARLEEQPGAARPGRHRNPAADDPTAGVTADGLTITATEVDLARSDYQRLRAAFAAADSQGALGPRGSQDRKFRTLELATARERFERLRDAYDVTDTGYAALLAEPARRSRHAQHEQWRERAERAEATRARPGAPVSEKAADDLPGAAARRDEAREKVRRAEQGYRERPSVRARGNYESAMKDYQAKQRVYLQALLARPDIAEAMASGDLRSPQTWTHLGSIADTARIDVWRAADVHAADTDAAEVRIGRLGEVEAIRRSLARAEARQSVLDAEGNGEIDSINRRFAESLRRKRGGAGA